MFQRKKIIISVILLFSSIFVFAQKIKVAYYPSKNFSEGTTDLEMKSGYCYEYLQLLSAITGWSYEYVHGDWTDLYNQFCEGKIDIFPGLSINPEREKLFLFPKMPMGTEVYYIYTSNKQSNLKEISTALFNNKRIGLIKSSFLTSTLRDWALQNDVSYEEVLFDSYEEVEQALFEDRVDAIVNTNNNVNVGSNLVPVKLIGGSAFYLAVTKKRPDLYGQLMAGLSSISEVNPNFTNILQQKYFNQTLVSSYLTKDETAFIKTKDLLRIGYIKNFRPFCDEEIDGSPFGLIEYFSETILDIIDSENKIAIEYTAFDTYEDLFNSVRNKEVDFIFPIYDNLWLSENEQVIQSAPLLSIDSNLIIRENFSADKIKSIGVTRTNWFQGVYVVMNYPDYEFVLYDTDEDCLKAILKNDVDCTVFNTFRANTYLSKQKYRHLTGLPTSKPASLCVGVNTDDILLSAVLNRCIHVMGTEQIRDKLYEYSKEDDGFSLTDYFMDNFLMFGSVILVIIVLILGSINFYVYKMKKSQVQLENQFELVEALTRNFRYAFLVNLTEKTCFILKIDGHIIEETDSHNNIEYSYDKMIYKYVIERVYKSDQENLINALKLDVVKEKLDENNEYTYNYRVFENEDVHSYQANFLKLQGKDGTEKVVLAFQNIDEIVAASKERELLKIKSETDTLTELVNKKCGEELVSEALVEKSSGGMFISLKIVDFEGIITKYGHSVGDEVLIFVADCLRKAFRAGDILFRAGKDDFSVLAFNIETEEAGRRVIERFFKRLENQNIQNLEGVGIYTNVGAKIIEKEEVITCEALQNCTEKNILKCSETDSGETGNKVCFS